MSRWFLYNKKNEYEKILPHLKELGLTKFQATILANREITSYEDLVAFVNPNLDHLHDPYLMRDMEIAVSMIVSAMENQAMIRIVGDYDQDGNSAIMTLMDGLAYYYENLSYAIPHRVEDGYGINETIVEKAKSDGVDLIITCDNGTGAFDAVEKAKELGMQVIVTDHHEPLIENGEQVLPKADAVLNPKRKDCSYPFKHLCGAGVAFKLIQGIFLKLEGDMEYVYDLLEYVAMGTICDIVPLIGENRIFVVEGLMRMNDTHNMGMESLIRANKWNKLIDEYTVGFVLGPCINAGGRLSTATKGVELFLSEDIDEIESLADELVELNNERKILTQDALEKAVERIREENLSSDSIVVVYASNINESVIGIVAGRIKDRLHRPVIVFTDSAEPGILKGSARSVEGYDMHFELSRVSNLLADFGGHKMAAGMSISRENLSRLRKALNEKTSLDRESLTKTVYIDLQLPIDMLSYDIINLIRRMKPFGSGNEKPIFADKRLKILHAKRIGKESQYMKLVLSNGKKNVDAVCFHEEVVEKLENLFPPQELNKSFRGEDNENYVDVVYDPTINDFNGNRTIQLKILDIR